MNRIIELDQKEISFIGGGDSADGQILPDSSDTGYPFGLTKTETVVFGVTLGVGSLLVIAGFSGVVVGAGVTACFFKYIRGQKRAAASVTALVVDSIMIGSVMGDMDPGKDFQVI